MNSTKNPTEVLLIYTVIDEDEEGENPEKEMNRTKLTPFVGLQSSQSKVELSLFSGTQGSETSREILTVSEFW